MLMEQLSAFIEEGEALLIPSVQEKFAEEKLAVKNVIFLTRVDPVTYELQESDGFGNMGIFGKVEKRRMHASL